MLGTRVQLLYAHPVTHAPCPYDNYHGGMPLLCSGPEKRPTGPISAICWLAAIPKRPEKNITATRHGSWQRGWLKQGSRGHAGDGDITASWYIYEQHETKIRLAATAGTIDRALGRVDDQCRLCVVRNRPRVRAPVTPIVSIHPSLLSIAFFASWVCPYVSATRVKWMWVCTLLSYIAAIAA